jgi:HEAT repeat protein
MAANSRKAVRRRARFAAALERPELSGLRSVAAEAGRSEAAARDLGIAVDRAWDGIAQADADMLRYEVRAAGLATTLLRATHSWMPRRRVRAASALGDLRLSEAASELDRLLRDRDPSVRLTAARALGRLATPEAARLLIAALEDGLVSEQRLVEVLGAPWAAGAVLLAFRAPRTVALRVPLADALGRARSAQAVDVFAAALPAASTELRIRIVRALARIGSPGAIAAVRAAMDDRNWRVRAQVAWSLARMGDPAARGLLERGQSDASPWVRANCAAALRRLARPPAGATRRAVPLR